MNDFAVRFVTALFGILSVALVFSLRRYLGTVGTLFAASLVALSPGLTFFSRYFIHEILLVFLTFAALVCVVKFIEGEPTGKVALAAMAIVLITCTLPVAFQVVTLLGIEDQTIRLVVRVLMVAIGVVAVYFSMVRLIAWNEGRPVYLLLAAACVAMAFATKETAFITLGTLLIALGCVALWRRIMQVASNNALSYKNFSKRLKDIQGTTILIGLCFVVFAFLGVIFFSSFFTNENGIKAAFEAYGIWTKTGSKDHTQSGMAGYLKWLLQIEAPILILGAIGSFIAFRKSHNSFALFVALWAFGLLAAYSIIPYKTPWIAINFVLPMALIAGYAINELANARQVLERLTAKLLAGFALAICAYQSIDLNFFRYDDGNVPYVYVHSLRSMNDMFSRIEDVTNRAGVGREATIIITSPENWPLPWTLHEFKNAGFFGSIVDNPNAEAIIGAKTQQAELDRRYSATHLPAGTYALRPGVELLLYIRKDLSQYDSS